MRLSGAAASLKAHVHAGGANDVKVSKLAPSVHAALKGALLTLLRCRAPPALPWHNKVLQMDDLSLNRIQTAAQHWCSAMQGCRCMHGFGNEVMPLSAAQACLASNGYDSMLQQRQPMVQTLPGPWLQMAQLIVQSHHMVLFHIWDLNYLFCAASLLTAITCHVTGIHEP